GSTIRSIAAGWATVTTLRTRSTAAAIAWQHAIGQTAMPRAALTAARAAPDPPNVPPTGVAKGRHDPGPVPGRRVGDQDLPVSGKGVHLSSPRHAREAVRVRSRAR